MKKLLMALLGGMMLASCVPMTPQARIQQNPHKFAGLSSKHKEMVERGEVARGMSRDAVYLAWGAPSAVFQGTKDSKTTERWDYAGSRAVPVGGFYGTYGYGYGRYGPYYGRRGYSAIGLGWGPDYAYIPYRIGSVWFLDNRVEAWERAR